ncbi:MAG: redoxin domain-containing protein, partial [Planctomycetes bacterium]|nr:redoxin domain-containing protein [Planctomycetota bacterium]
MNQIPPHYRVLRRGDPAPWFRQRSTSSEGFNFDTVAGRWLVLCFFGSAADDLSREALRLIDERREEFDDEHASFFGISLDPADEKERRVGQQLPGVRMFWDYDGR